MPAARYWRAVGMTTYGGGDAEISEMHLYGGGDTSYAAVALLLQGTGADGSTAFVDHSPAPKTLTGNGDVQNSTVDMVFANPSVRFDGSGDFILGPKSTAFTFDSSDFTIELFVNQASRSAEQILVGVRDAASGIFDGMIRIDSGGYVGFTDGSAWRTTTNSVPLGAWRHIAVVRQSGVLSIYVNGELGHQSSFTQAMTQPRQLAIGAAEGYGGGGAVAFFHGFMDQVRITKGVARYLANFVPPVAPFPINGDVFVRVDQPASVNTRIPLISGSVENLQDDSLLTTAAFVVRAPGAGITWDFGDSPTDVGTVVLGSASSRSSFISGLDLQYSTDGLSWTQLARLAAFPWPGANAKTVAGVFDPTPLLTHTASSAEQFFSESLPFAGARDTSRPRLLRDMQYAGRGQIVATVKEDHDPLDLPVRRRVRLFRDRDGVMIRETWSDATTGAYAFTEIDENERYSVVAYDHLENYRAVIADRIQPTVP